MLCFVLHFVTHDHPPTPSSTLLHYTIYPRRWYGYIYPFMEISLGILYLSFGMLSQGITLPHGVTYRLGTKFMTVPWGNGLITRAMCLWQIMNGCTMMLMGVSSIGVIQALLKRQELVCACLGN